MINDDFCMVHDVVIGKPGRDKLLNEKQIGHALIAECETKPFYRVSVWSMQETTFYITKNRANDRYTVFARMQDGGENGSASFSQPIGFAYISSDLKEFMQVQLNFPWQKFFVCLYPKSTNQQKDI